MSPAAATAAPPPPSAGRRAFAIRHHDIRLFASAGNHFRLLGRLAGTGVGLRRRVATAAPPAASAPAPTTVLVARLTSLTSLTGFLGVRLRGAFLFLGLHRDRPDDRFPFGGTCRLALLQLEGRGADGLVGPDRDDDAEALLQFAQVSALVVKHVEGDFRPGAQREVGGLALEQFRFDPAEQVQGHRFHRADIARALAVRAVLHGGLEHTGANALPRHFQEAEMADPTDLDAGAVMAQRVLETPLHGPVVALLLHVDEVDDDEAGEIAQPQLARHLVGGFQVRLQRGVLDIVLAGRPPRVHIDGDQCLCLVEDDVAAGLERHARADHRIELRFDPVLGEDRLVIAIGLDVLGMARHEHAHEILGLPVGFVARHENLVYVLGVEIADRPLHQAAFLVDEGRRDGFQRELAHVLPEPEQVLEVALDLRLGARGARGAQDDAHPLRYVQFADDALEPLAVGGVDDLAGNAAAARRVRHQHRIAAGERQIRGQRGALVAALFLDDLNEQNLPLLDDFLDFIGAPRPGLSRRHFLEGVVTADGFDGVVSRTGDFLDSVAGPVFARLRIVVGLCFRSGGRLAGRLFVRIVLRLAECLLVFFLRGEQRLPVGKGDLVVVRMDFAEGEEAVPVAAVIDKGGLERRLYAGDFCKVDVAAKLAPRSGLEVEFLDLSFVQNDDPGFLRMRRIDKHLGWHVLNSESQESTRAIAAILDGAGGRAGSAGCVPGPGACRESGKRMMRLRAFPTGSKRSAP